MLADTDAGSVITAAQSGARWGYAMIVPQLALIPVLYVVQEMTARLGVVTGAGHGTLIRRRFGRGWALVSAGTLFASAVGALVTEFAAVAGAGELFGISRWVSVPAATAFLAGVAFTGSYRRTERAGIALGLAEAAFVAAMLMSRPAAPALARGLLSLPLGSGSYRYLLAANVGAVIMPWMIFYQQRAVIDKGLRPAGLNRERAGTAIGAVVTQLVMISVVITVASVARHGGRPGSLGTVGQISASLRPVLGATGARVVFGAGMLGVALVAALVASLAGAWGLAEISGWQHTLNRRPGRATAKFCTVYLLAHVAGAAVVLASADLVGLAVGVEVMNALLLPVVLGFLLVLEATALPPGQRMRGWYKGVTRALCLVVIAFGLSMIPAVLGFR
jgi:Mn2+/Fe2+ NRAMP family transporter